MMNNDNYRKRNGTEVRRFAVIPREIIDTCRSHRVRRATELSWHRPSINHSTDVTSLKYLDKINRLFFNARSFIFMILSSCPMRQTGTRTKPMKMKIIPAPRKSCYRTRKVSKVLGRFTVLTVDRTIQQPFPFIQRLSNALCRSIRRTHIHSQRVRKNLVKLSSDPRYQYLARLRKLHRRKWLQVRRFRLYIDNKYANVLTTTGNNVDERATQACERVYSASIYIQFEICILWSRGYISVEERQRIIRTPSYCWNQ